MSLLTARAVLSVVGVRLSLALARLGKVLEGREGFFCLDSFPEVISLSPSWRTQVLSHPLIFL